MRILHIDIETYSPAPLAKCGVYKYAEASDFCILLFGYSEDGGPVHVVDIASGERPPPEILAALTDPAVIKVAHNASFERVCLSRPLGLPPGAYLPASQWQCTMIAAGTLGLPSSLKDLGKVLGLEEQKLEEGKKLIRLFCGPQRRDGRRVLPNERPKEWEVFKAYNARDVEVEVKIHGVFSKYWPSESIWEQYALDQTINDRGVAIDAPFVGQAIALDGRAREEAMARMRALTGLSNPNSVVQIRQWLAEQGIETETLGKEAVEELLKGELPETAREALELRLETAKSSVSKYRRMLAVACSDGRARGCFQFYGAPRTGRYSGKLIQLQNLPRNDIPDLEAARELVLKGDYDGLKAACGSVSSGLSQLVRTAFVPAEGRLFLVADYSAIEARVLAWMAGEEWRLKLFREGGDVYCMSASTMFGVPVEKHGVNGHLRQRGKVAELACGYGGSVGALKAMGALRMGLKEAELPGIVRAWRRANPRVVRFWWDVDSAVKKVVRERGGRVRVGRVEISYKGQMLWIRLPSNRFLAYPKPRLGKNKFGGESIVFEGLGPTRKWGKIETYGPKLVENLVQGTSRDLLCEAMLALKDRRIVMHIHDEIILEATKEETLEELCEVMGQTPAWAEGLPLRADGYACDFYKKD